MPDDVSMMGSVLEYRLNVQFVQSRVRSCLHASVISQSTHSRTKTASHDAAMKTLQPTSASTCTMSE